jgi:hypothetical protein
MSGQYKLSSRMYLLLSQGKESIGEKSHDNKRFSEPFIRFGRISDEQNEVSYNDVDPRLRFYEYCLKAG